MRKKSQEKFSKTVCFCDFGLTDGAVLLIDEYSSARFLGCRDKANWLHMGPGLTGGVPSMGGLSKGS